MMTPRFSKSDIEREMAIRMQRIEVAIINRLKQLGEKCVNEARSSDEYKDQTGNLRSSIGYVILKDGAIIKRDFELSEQGSDRTSGFDNGNSFADSLSHNYPTGYALIVVAGMNYAELVEAKGRNVLSSAESFAKMELPSMMRQLKTKIGKMK